MGSISTSEKKEQEPNSPLDDLPDDILQIIINGVVDAKTLVRCLSLNKRFASLVPLTDVVSLHLHIPHTPPPRPQNNNNNNGGNPVNILKSVVSYIFTKLFLRRNNRRERGDSDNSLVVSDSICQFPPQILRPFRNLTRLHLELHMHGGAVDNQILKWKASYGSELKTCVVLCATSSRRLESGESSKTESEGGEQAGDPAPPAVPNDEFKSRITWTISCLIAASARHFLLKQMLAKFPTVKAVTITDSRRQGRLSVTDDEIRDLRESLREEGSMELTLERVVPDLRMRMLYVPELVLPAVGCALKGATLLLMGPADGVGEMVPPLSEEDGGGFDGNAAEKALFAEAEREIVKMEKRSIYVMEMTSF